MSPAHQACTQLITHNHQWEPMMSAVIHLDFPMEEEEEAAQLFVTEVDFFLTPERSCWCLNNATTLFKITSHGRVTFHNIMRTFQERLRALCSSSCDGSQCGSGVMGRNDWVDSRSMKPYSGAQSQKTDSDKNVGVSSRCTSSQVVLSSYCLLALGQM